MAVYNKFYLEPADSDYTIHVSEYDEFSSAGDILNYSVGKKFSARDHDVDSDSTHCAQVYKTGWWFNSCGSNSNFNIQRTDMLTEIKFFQQQ